MVEFYVDYFNITNKETYEDSVLTICESTNAIRAGFARRKKQMGWTYDNLSQPVMDKEFFDYSDFGWVSLGEVN